MNPGEAEARLTAAGLVTRSRGAPRTTRRWQGAMMRAAATLRELETPNASHDELELDTAYRWASSAALLGFFPEATDGEVAAMVRILLPLELQEAGALAPDER